MLGGLSSVLSLLLSLVFIIVLVIVSIRLLGRQSGMKLNQQLVRVVSVLPLGTNKSLQVIIIGSKRILVVGVGNQVEPLASFEDEELAAELMQMTPSSSGSLSGLSLLKGLTQVGQSFRTRRKKKVSIDQLLQAHDSDEWATMQERLDFLRLRRNEALQDTTINEPINNSAEPSFQDMLTDIARRSK